MGNTCPRCLYDYHDAIPNLDSLFNEVSDENNIKVIYDANKLFEQPDNEDQLMAKADLLLERESLLHTDFWVNTI